jgi:hypothetical protein
MSTDIVLRLSACTGPWGDAMLAADAKAEILHLRALLSQAEHFRDVAEADAMACRKGLRPFAEAYWFWRGKGRRATLVCEIGDFARAAELLGDEDGDKRGKPE